MKLSKPGPAIVIPNSLREGLAKLSPEAREVALKLIRAKVRRLRKMGPPKTTYPLPTERIGPETDFVLDCRLRSVYRLLRLVSSKPEK